MPSSRPILDRLFSLEGKVALVTGASGGIGSVLAGAFGEAGASVVVHGRRTEELAKTRRQIEAAGAKALVLSADLNKRDACRTLIADTLAHFGRLDILVNCAGMNRRNPIEKATEDDFDAIMAVNLTSAVALCHEAHAPMKRQGGGKIINVGSITSTYGLGSVGIYGITKSALAQFTAALAVRWAKDNIQVNCLAPGFMLTPLTEKPIWADPARRRFLIERIPAARPGEPEELVGTALLLASGASSYLTGQLITIDGGFLTGASWPSPQPWADVHKTEGGG